MPPTTQPGHLPEAQQRYTVRYQGNASVPGCKRAGTACAVRLPEFPPVQAARRFDPLQLHSLRLRDERESGVYAR